MKNDGSQSWIVISRGMNQHVNELPEESGKSIHNEEVATRTRRPAATKQKEQYTSPLSSLATIVLPIDQRKCKDILAVDYVDQRIFDIQCLEDNDPNTTTSRNR